ncbi:hypothetical protein ACQ4PT_000839 [Festuca glaucescens]
MVPESLDLRRPNGSAAPSSRPIAGIQGGVLNGGGWRCPSPPRAGILSSWIPSAAAVDQQPSTSSSLGAELEAAWLPVRPAHWWRKLSSFQSHSRRVKGQGHSTRPFLPAHIQREKKGDKVRGRDRKCFRCFAPGHLARDCRNPIRCHYCFKLGHTSKVCRRRRRDLLDEALRSKPPASASPLQRHTQGQVLPPPPPGPPPAPQQVLPPPPPGPPPAAAVRMAMPRRIGDPTALPAEGHVVVARSTAIAQAEDSLVNHAVFIHLGGNRPKVNAADITKAIEEHTNIHHDLFRVVPTYPDDFFATFKYQHNREQVASPGRFTLRGLDLHISRWTKLAHAEATCLNFHFHLCLEGIPCQAWDDDAVGRIVGKNCIVNYFDVATIQKEDTSVMSLWAWCAHPNDLPKVMWLTILDGPSPTFDVRADNSLQGKKVLTYKVVIHLDIHEDLSPGADGGPPQNPPRERHDWRLGYAAGEQPMRVRRACSAHDDRDNWRRDNDRRDDDDDRGGRPDDRRSWAGRLFRSRSRADGGARDGRNGGDRQRDEGRRDGRQDDRGQGGRDNHRDHRRAELPAPDHRTVDPKKFQLLKDGSMIPASGSRRRGRASPLPSARRGKETYGAGPRGRSPPPRRLASIICVGADGPVFQAPSQPRCAPGSSRSPLSGSAARQAPTGSLSCSRRLDFSPAPSAVAQGSAGPWETPCRSISPTASTPVHDGAAMARTPPIAPAAPDGQLQLFDGRLFATVPAPLLTLPESPSPRLTPPAARRKTLAGVTSFNLQRSSVRIPRKGKRASVAVFAEQLLCKHLGILQDGEKLTEAAITKFADMFQGRLPPIAFDALRALFHLDCDLAAAVEGALLAHGGAATLDHAPDAEAGNGTAVA